MSNEIVITPVSDVLPADITAPKPKEVAVPAIENKASLLTVPESVPTSYTPVDVDAGEPFTNEFFHRPTKSLKESVDTRLTELTAAMRKLAEDVNTSTAQNSNEVALKIEALANDANAQFKLMAESEADQSRDVAASINRVKGDFLTEITKIVTRVVSNTDRLDAVEKVASGDSAKILEDFQKVKGIIETFQASDDGKFLDVLDEMKDIVKRVNETRVLHQFAMSVQPINGIINLNTRALGIGEFANASDFIVNAGVFNDATLQVSVINQTKDGCDLLVRTNGTTIKPAPIKDRVVTVNVVLSHLPPVTLKLDSGYMNEAVVA